jgi:hypothetical protein
MPTGCTVYNISPQDTPNEGRTKINDNFACLATGSVTGFSGSISSQTWQEALAEGNVATQDGPILSGASITFRRTDNSNDGFSISGDSGGNLVVERQSSTESYTAISHKGEGIAFKTNGDNGVDNPSYIFSALAPITGNTKLSVYDLVNTATLKFTELLTADREYKLPDADGTLALTSDLTGSQTWQEVLTQGNLATQNGPIFSGTSISFRRTNNSNDGYVISGDSIGSLAIERQRSSETYTSMYFGGKHIAFKTDGPGADNPSYTFSALSSVTGATKLQVYDLVNTATLMFTELLTADREYKLPDADGTLALTSDLTVSQTWQEALTEGNVATQDGPILSGTSISFRRTNNSNEGFSISGDSTGFITIDKQSAVESYAVMAHAGKDITFQTDGGNGVDNPSYSFGAGVPYTGDTILQVYDMVNTATLKFTELLTADREYKFPDADGTLALTPILATQTIPCAATSVWDLDLGHNAKISLTADTTFSITNIEAGDSGTIAVSQDVTGGHVATPPGSSIVANGAGGLLNITTTGSAVDLLTFYYDGTTYYWSVGANYT